ncbi:MAG: phenylalanine--tRNA ligase subunit alpha, partial [Dehalococcoidia bacterium]|nr:phenylalanine--tRNA ligase subunit alpha [Dehalococcoidia bacterium]
MRDQLEDLRSRALQELEIIGQERELEEWRVKYLGRKGTLTTMLRSVGGLSDAERPAAGALANEVKKALEAALADKDKDLKQAEMIRKMGAAAIDVTLPGRSVRRGGWHPTTSMVKEIVSVFARMGFQVVEGPEVEWDY